MRIVYLHQYFITPQMAGGSRSYEMARRLVAAGHEVHMVTSDQTGKDDGTRWRASVETGINVHCTPVGYDNEMAYRQRIGAFLRFAWRAARKARELGPDIIFATSTPLTIAIPAAYAARRCRVPMVFEVRDLWPAVPIAIGAIRNPSLRQSLLSTMTRHFGRSCVKGPRRGRSGSTTQYGHENSRRFVSSSPGNSLCRADHQGVGFTKICRFSIS
jgi:hypothetical protein